MVGWNLSVLIRRNPNNFRDIFRTVSAPPEVVAVSNQTDQGQHRISASRLDYNSIQRASTKKKNTFSLNSSLKLNDPRKRGCHRQLCQHAHAQQALRNQPAAQSFDGFFGREEDMSLILIKFQTSAGYKWVPYNQPQRIPPKHSFLM